MSGSDSELFLGCLLGAFRELDSVSTVGSLVASDGFADRVMAAVAAEPMPRTPFMAGATGLMQVFAVPFAAISEAWRVSMTQGRPPAARAQAFALILALAFAVGSTSVLAAIGAGHWLAADGRHNPVAVPAPTPPTTEGVLPPTASPDPIPTPTSEPVATPEAPAGAAAPGTTSGSNPSAGTRPPHVRGTPEPTERPDGSERDGGSDPTDDHGGDGTSTSPDGPGVPDLSTPEATAPDSGG